MEKLSVILVKYVVLPGLICWAGYAFLGPRIGKGASDSLPEKSAADAATIESPAPVDDPAALAATDNDPKPDKGAPTEAKTAVSPPTDDKAPAKFDADVPVNSGDKTPTASSNDPTATVADPDASVVKITRPRIVKKKAPPKPPVDGDATDAAPPTVIHKKSNPEEGPGDDLRKLKTKPKKDPVKEKDPNLPTTPPDDPGTGGGGGTGAGTGAGTNGSPNGG